MAKVASDFGDTERILAGIIEVAHRAGVSTATVSRVLSHPDVVSIKTRDRVMRAIDELGYQPNRAARMLRTHRAHKILVMVPDISNPFFSNIIRGAEAASRDAGYAIILGDTRDDPELENQYAVMLQRREVDGVLFLGQRIPDVLDHIIAKAGASAPVVNACEYRSDMPVSSVHIDNAAAASQAIRHLCELGHRTIGIVTGTLESPLTLDRIAGVRAEAERAGIADDFRFVQGDYSVQSGFDCARALLADGKISAIFCFSDEMALGALDAIASSGRHCPNDVSVVGFDDIRLARHMRPRLTTVAQPSAEIGRRAIQTLMNILQGNQKTLENVVLPFELIVRESTGRVAPHARFHTLPEISSQ